MPDHEKGGAIKKREQNELTTCLRCGSSVHGALDGANTTVAEVAGVGRQSHEIGGVGEPGFWRGDLGGAGVVAMSIETQETHRASREIISYVRGS